MRRDSASGERSPSITAASGGGTARGVRSRALNTRLSRREEGREVERAARDLEIAREAVQDPAPLARALGREDRQRLLVGVAAVDEHRLPGPPRERQLRTKRALLSLPRREVTEEVESGLADRDDAGGLRDPPLLRKSRPLRGGGFVPAGTDSRPH